MDNWTKFKDAYDWLKYHKVFKTQEELGSLLGYSRGAINKALNGKEEYLTQDLIDAITRYVSEYSKKNEASSASGVAVGTNNGTITQNNGVSHQGDQPHAYAHENTHALVPTIPYKVYNETGINLMEYVHTNPVPKGPAIAQFAQTDLHMFVANDEMKPHLRAGDVLSLKQVPQGAPIINGEIYVINSQYLGVTIRYVYDRGEYLELKSSNDWYEPFTIPRDQVFGIFRILGLVRTNI